jgi:iron complex outermembrane recepter protein
MMDDTFRAFVARVMQLSLVSLACVSLLSPVAFAQDEDDESDSTPSARDEGMEEVVVTGSRLKRDTYTSIAPLQVITGQVSREIGSIDPSTILQESTSAAGTQVDLSLNGLVLDNGPGSSTIDLRGLGASRTLVLINGRRAAPAGVEGAPISPDLNLVPSTLVQQYEILLDGASSVYGSDAIAGVSNIILRKDFEGLELESYTTIPDEEHGVQNTVSVAWGTTTDRGFFGAAAEYTQIDSVSFDDRPWTAGCNKNLEIDENGHRRSEFLTYEYLYGMKTTPCKISFARRAWDYYSGWGSIYYTPGTSNIGIPNLSESTVFEIPLDQNQDGVPDVDFTDYNYNGALGHGDMFPDHERVSVMAYGEHTLSGDMNVTPYFEVNWNQRETTVYDPGAVLFELVPETNPYNPCNTQGIDGADCYHAWDNLLNDPVYSAVFASYYGGTPEEYYQFVGLDLYNDHDNVLGPIDLPLEAQASIRGDRDNTWSKVSQIRFVAGVKGDLPQIDWGSMDNWSFDVALVYSDATGKSLRSGVNEQKLLYSLETSVLDPMTGQVTCGNGSDCVPVNLFAPSLYEGLVDNDFATQAERDYLMSDRKFDTKYKQTDISAIATGDLFGLPGGDAAGAVGIEYRIDDIDSIPNEVARDGELWGFFADRGAVGNKDTKEFFAEIELPLFANYPGMHELTTNLSTRYTKDELYPGNWTYSAKLAYRPIDSLLIRGTAGTSYRAPNLREVYMLGQTGFRNLVDPCVTPDNAIVLGVYDPTLDTREQHVLANCYAAGVDPTNLGFISQTQTSPIYSVEVAGIGRKDLNEEQSKSWTAGFAFEQPWAEAFDLTIGATYYEIEITDQIIRLHSQYSIDDCYYDLEGDSAFCDYITRDLAGDGLISFSDEPFINQDATKTRGIDFNVALDWPAQFFGRAVDVSMDLVANRKLQFTEIYKNPSNDVVDEEDYVGEFGFPEWEGHGIVRLDMGKWRLTWSTRYIGAVEEDPLGVDNFGNVPSGTADTCLGPALGDVNCRDIGYADHYYRHDVSLYFRGDVWTLGGGVRNLQNTWPPQVDSDEVLYVYNNTPMGRGYDVMGRSYFLNIAANFQ